MRMNWIATQLSLGSRADAALPLSAVQAAIRTAVDLAGVQAVMVWPSGNVEAIERDVSAVRRSGAEPWLWFPLLADVPGRRPRPDQQVMLFDGNRGHGKLGAWNGLGAGEEEFLFSCPNDPVFVDAVEQWLSEILERVEVRGVMLDRIRYPSPANGLESLFTCFCPRCETLFRSEKGYPLARLADRARSFLQRAQRLTGESFSAEWRSGDTLWTISGLADLALFRSRSITRLVQRVSGLLRGRGRKIGLDLFSPRLGPIVAQDYGALAPLVDWIKPMMYCHARGPAGFPLETACLQAALRELASGIGAEDAARMIGASLGMEVPAAGSFPLSTITREIDLIESMHLPAGLSIMAGLEAVRLPELPIDVPGEDLSSALELVRERCDGLIASWNLLHIPHDNLRRIGAASR